MKSVPTSLQTWFLIHFLVDMVFAIPLLISPEWTLGLFGLEGESMISARLVGAALIGIGGNSLLMNKQGKEHFLAMLNLKILWSGAAIVALALELAQGGSPTLWIVLAIFFGFALLWNVYAVRLSRL